MRNRSGRAVIAGKLPFDRHARVLARYEAANIHACFSAVTST